jgi:hypothetical protein
MEVRDWEKIADGDGKTHEHHKGFKLFSLQNKSYLVII